MRPYRILVLLVWVAVAGAQTIITVAGQGPSHRSDIDGEAAASAPLSFTYGLMKSPSSGRLILHDQGMIDRIEPDGRILAIAGGLNPFNGSTAEGTPASAFRFGILRGMAEDAAGSLYVADAAAGRVYRIGRDGLVMTFAGGSTDRSSASNGDGGPAVRATLYSPRGLAFDSKGNLYIADAITRSIRRVSPEGTITTFYTLPATPTAFDHVRPFAYFEGLAIDARDNLYAAVYSADQVLRLSPDGAITIVAGSGEFGFSGDGGPAVKAQLNLPSGVAVDASGSLYIADTGNQRIRKVSPDGTISSLAGTGTAGFSGDGGPAALAQLNSPAQVLPATDGSLYVADFGNRRIRVISSAGVISTLAGSGEDSQPSASTGDGGPAIAATLNTAVASIFDRDGNLLVADAFGGRIRKITPGAVITTVAGDGTLGFAGDNGPAVNARIGSPLGIAVDQQGSIYLAGADSRVRRIDPTGVITTVAGTGMGSGLDRAQGDGGPATAATLNEPKGVAVDAAGNLYIADTSNARLRVVDGRGIIRTLAGPGQLGADYWNGVATDGRGNVYVSITHLESPGYWSVIDRVAADGSRTRVAGTGQPCDTRTVPEFPYDGKPATSVPLCTVLSMTFDAGGSLYIPESFYGVVLRVDAAGNIARIAGSSLATELGDGGPALAARFTSSGYFAPADVSIDRNGNLFVPSGNRVREVTSTPLTLRLSQTRLDLKPGAPQSVAITTNFDESFPYVVQTATVDGGDWISVNRASGLTGESLAVSAVGAGLAPGVYRGTITVKLVAGSSLSADLPVTLTVP